MTRKILLLLIVAGFLSIPLKSVNAADNANINQYPNYTIVTEQEERLIEIKNRNVERGYLGDGVIISPSEEQIQMMEKKKTNNRTKNDGQVGTMIVSATDGSTQILTVSPYSNGTLIQQDYKSGIANTIWNTSMYVAGKVLKTVGGIVLDIVNYYVDTIDKNRGTNVYTYKSYRYIGKDVKVYDADSGSWQLWYQAKSRESYAHTLSTYVNLSGYTRTHGYDYTGDKGYEPILTDFSPNYNNNSELSYRAWYNWYKGFKAYSSPEYGY